MDYLNFTQQPPDYGRFTGMPQYFGPEIERTTELGTRRLMKIFLRMLAAVAAVLTLSGQAAESDSLDAAFEQDVLIIETMSSGCFKFEVYLAVTNDQQRRGLMFVRKLPEFTGMLFLYPKAGVRSMWMKNTYIPLDILFARDDGSVSSIATNTEPLSLKSLSAIEPVNFVLELNAGIAAKLGIGQGSRLIFDLPE